MCGRFIHKNDLIRRKVQGLLFPELPQCQYCLCIGIFKHICQAIRRILVVKGDKDRTCPKDCDCSEQDILCVWHIYSNSISRSDTQCSEHTGKGGTELLQFAVAYLSARIGDRSLIGKCRGVFCYLFVEQFHYPFPPK